MIALLAGCESRVGRAFSDLTGQADSATVQTAPIAPPAQTVLAPTPIGPAYVLPGAPTYIESSQAANVQNFEAVYGPPVVDVAAGTYVDSQPSYSLPSYDDGSVAVTTLAAPTAPIQTAQPSIRTYTQQVLLDAPVATPLAPAPVFGPEPVFGPAPVAATAAQFTPLPVETASSVPTFGIEAAAIDVVPSAEAFDAPVMVDGPLTAGEELLGLDTTALDGLVQTGPTAYDVGPAIDTFETNTILDSGFDALPVEQIYDDIPTPAALPPEYGASIGGTTGGFEIIGNDEAIRQFEGASAPAPAALAPVPSSVFEDAAPLSRIEDPSTGGQFQVMPQTSVAPTTAPVSAPSFATMAPIADDEDFRVAAAVPAVPEPRAKVTVERTAAAAIRVPLPRQRPARSERSYATLTTPLPQPRPSYGEPVAVATTAGYVSIGSLDDIETTELAPPASAPSAQATAPTEAAAATPASLTGASELSGTSWRLVSVNAAPVSANAELHFDGSSGFAGGQGPCNSYGGEFMNVGKGMFSMNNIFTTDMACPSIGVENQYIEALEKAKRYDIKGNFADLILRDDSGATIAAFKAF